MTTSCNTAVILAAGLGSRLKDRTKNLPKGFLEIEGQSLIERSIGNLLSKGISNIIIGTGYLHQHFDQLKLKFPAVTTLRNEDFASTGSMYTLYVLRNLIQGSFLLLESDLLYEPLALHALLHDPHSDVILASGKTQSGDEVYIQHSSEGFLQNMSKDPQVLAHVDGELVGISKLSSHTLNKMVLYAETQYRLGNKGIHYEDALVGVASDQPIKIKVIPDLAWCEIDDEQHLHRALEIVYPKIKERS